ncbi:DUF4199 domain-containing protein [Flavobacterium sp. 3HN19-14]|uniref:DUF4199 domain-containing protein n=1 Tax=Flavobacterium sp. 3HN19-14 TaxID=3448133 RepID=UPI003EDE93F3
MKKIIIKYGFISGAIATIFMVIASVMMHNDPNFHGSMIMGFGGMLIAFSFIFLGIKNFRDKQNGGTVSFGKALQIGILIALISATCYTGVWMLEHHFLYPDFMEKYSALQLKHLSESGLSAGEVQTKTAEIMKMKEDYKNPFMRIMYTYMEIFPLGIIVALISALILKKKAVVL